MGCPRRYAAPGNQATITTSFKTALTIVASTSTRGAIYHFVLSTLGVAADGVLEWALKAFTSPGTTTAVTPRKLDGGDTVALLAAGSNATVEPTYTASSEVFDQGINQRATYTWIAIPGGEILVPATASNGYGFVALSTVSPAYTGQANAQAHFAE